jgi:hypothetical protein
MTVTSLRVRPTATSLLPAIIVTGASSRDREGSIRVRRCLIKDSAVGRGVAMLKLLTAMALLTVMTTACSVEPDRRDTVQRLNRDPPIGEILRVNSLQRSGEECKVNKISDEQCIKSRESSQQHLDSVTARIEALLKDTKTNMCDLVRWAGSCNNPDYTLGDLADCLQVAADRGEALNAGRFILKLDSHGCPTDSK